jgi:hypothetical protein
LKADFLIRYNLKNCTVLNITEHFLDVPVLLIFGTKKEMEINQWQNLMLEVYFEVKPFFKLYIVLDM